MPSNGLVIGKFAPLHKGHELVISRSITENDMTYVIIYDCPEFIKIPLSVRAKWIQDRFKGCKLTVLEAWGSSNEVSRNARVKKMHEEYILNLLGDIKIDRFYSSEFYGKHMSKALGAKDCRVDTKRLEIPISGTELRNNWRQHGAQYLSHYPYQSIRPLVLLLGAPSTGKTTLCKALAKYYNTQWVPEYGREYWARFNKNRRLTLPQLDTIARTHYSKVVKAYDKATSVLFVDTDASTTRNFAKYYHGQSTAALDFYVARSPVTYDITVVCDTDIPYDDTADRSGVGSRVLFQRQILGDLELRKIPYTVVSGTVVERIKQVSKLLETRML